MRHRILSGQVMKKQLPALLFSLIVMLLLQGHLIAQCVPAASNTCDSANVICSLTELNGFHCQNTDKVNSSGCRPLCPTGGIANNTSWWAFASNGGNVCLTIEFSNCSVLGSGIQFGLYGSCDCKDTVFCHSDCTGPGKYQLCGQLDPCKTYYFFVDGCSGDVCDFTINTDLIDTIKTKLTTLGRINGPTLVCKGQCNVIHTIRMDSGRCLPNYIWTLDGSELNQHGDTLRNDFNQEGNFVLCVSAVIGNPLAGTICDETGPHCIAIQVRQEKDRTAGPRYVCPEETPLIWHGLTINSSGEYTLRFKDKNCCEYDSVITIIIPDPPVPPDIYYLGCTGDVYRDSITGKEVTSCQDHLVITLPHVTVPHQCDSSYLLHAAFLQGSGRFREYCQNGRVVLEVQPLDLTCAVNGYFTESFQYSWYKKTDSTKTSLGTDEFIEVGCNQEEYCVDLTLNGKLDKQTKKCTFTICEQYNESDFCYPQICPKGNLTSQVGKIVTYTVDAVFPTDARHIWTVSGGLILTQNPIDSTSIQVHWNFDPSPQNEYDGYICYMLQSSCPETKECCITIKVSKETAVNDIVHDEGSLTIFVQPSDHSFRILDTRDLNIQRAQLYDIKGKLITEWFNMDQRSLFRFDNATAGLYLFYMRTDHKQYISKVFVP